MRGGNSSSPTFTVSGEASVLFSISALKTLAVDSKMWVVFMTRNIASQKGSVYLSDERIKLFPTAEQYRRLN